MKKFVTSIAAASFVLGSAVSAQAQTVPAIDRDAVEVSDAEGFGGGSALIVLLFALIAAGIVVLIEDKEDEDDLPTSP
ncbi:hypothetical protein GRI62_06845 [Erythrobacter arachoides]|uniref:Ferrochelatase n=1 Tax=Aurantiacibacter arachoides TaxID=1850444 RepID=A0A845A1I2_9SPHN|nr:hypothetical protein [Aurantiacibacter arachoides]MXO93322.1 hypothetical protein [Aurantiacibacter arachoides]GGD50289.1 hypothetical protein GCM10011411_07610 [Aurantiacibacter arachoides]